LVLPPLPYGGVGITLITSMTEKRKRKTEKISSTKGRRPYSIQ